MSETIDFADIAVTAAEAGADVATDGFDTDSTIEIKSDTDGPTGPADIVTRTDRETQRRIVEVLTELDPDATIVGEENDAIKTVPSTGRAWVIDPIDGTFNFVRGLHYWTTSVAATVDGDVVAACSSLPTVTTTYHSDASTAYRDGEPIAVSDRSDDRSATVAPIIPPSHGDRETYVTGLGDLFERFGTTVRLCSAQATLALIARGSLDAAVTPQRPNPWDSLAGAHLIRQAGGVVTDLAGDRWTAESDSMVASNGKVHDDLLDAAQGLR